MTVTRHDLYAIKARADAATPAPWTPGDTNPQAVVARNVNKHGQHRVIGNWGTHVDAEFVAHARQDIPKLLNALSAMTRERDQAIQNLCDDGPCPVEVLHGEAVARAVAAERDLDQERTQHEVTKSTLDMAWDDLRQARQILADAPHEYFCAARSGLGCTCWKSSL